MPRIRHKLAQNSSEAAVSATANANVIRDRGVAPSEQPADMRALRFEQLRGLLSRHVFRATVTTRDDSSSTRKQNKRGRKRGNGACNQSDLDVSSSSETLATELTGIDDFIEVKDFAIVLTLRAPPTLTNHSNSTSRLSCLMDYPMSLKGVLVMFKRSRRRRTDNLSHIFCLLSSLREALLLKVFFILLSCISDVECLVGNTPAAVTDSLSIYDIAGTSDTACAEGGFLTNLYGAYLEVIRSPTQPGGGLAAPEGVTGCALCERNHINLSAHHLIPRAVHDKAIKRGWASDLTECRTRIAWLCRACHDFVHKIASHEQLAKHYNTVEALEAREDVKDWIGWVSRVRWTKT